MYQKKLKINSDLKIPLDKMGGKLTMGGIQYVTFKQNISKNYFSKHY